MGLGLLFFASYVVVEGGDYVGEEVADEDFFAVFGVLDGLLVEEGEVVFDF